ncbi:MAG: virulence factor [Anaerolineales bacterium]
MAKYKVLYWYDIPLQVRAEDKDGRVNRQLPERFQLAVDEVAMAAKMISDDNYTAGFQWQSAQDKEGSAKDVAEAVIAELDAQFAEIDVQVLTDKLRQIKSADKP